MTTEITTIEHTEDVVASVVNTSVEETQRLTVLFSNIISKFQAMLPSIIFALIIFAVGIILSRLIVSIMVKFLKKSNVDRTAYGFLKSFVKISLYSIVIVITLTILKVPMTSIIAVMGAAGLAVGLALQNSLSNLAGGFIILFAKPFKVGDFIETDSVSGSVENISILYTRLATPDNKIVHIPNGNVSSAKIINYTERDTRRLDLEVAISYQDDFLEAQKIIANVIDKNPLALKEPQPVIRVGKQLENSIVLYVRVWVSTGNYANLNFDILEAVKLSFDENNIQVPRNSIDVRVEQ